MTALLALALGLGGAAPAAEGVHPFHVTLAEAEYNAESRRLEVALRVYHPLDLETALTRRAGRTSSRCAT